MNWPLEWTVRYGKGARLHVDLRPRLERATPSPPACVAPACRRSWCAPSSGWRAARRTTRCRPISPPRTRPPCAARSRSPARRHARESPLGVGRSWPPAGVLRLVAAGQRQPRLEPAEEHREPGPLQRAPQLARRARRPHRHLPPEGAFGEGRAARGRRHPHRTRASPEPGCPSRRARTASGP